MNGAGRNATRRLPSISMPPLHSLAILSVAVVLICCGCGAHADRHTTTMRWSSDGFSRTVEVRGSVEFTDDDRDVKTISPGGSFSIEDGNWLTARRSYLVTADSNGSLS